VTAEIGESHALAALLSRALPVVGPLALVWSVVFAMHLVRYVLSAGTVAIACARVPALRGSRLQSRRADEAQRRMEFRASLRAGAIFALEFLPLLYAIPAGWTQVYTDASRFGTTYLFVSFAAALVLHDAYFYWTHRWMHRPAVFRAMHLHHHRSHTPTPWAAFSFHGLESAVQGGIHLLIPFVLPIHVSVLGAFVVWATLYSALIHCGHDAFLARGPRGLRWHGRWLATALDHDAHHRGAPGNYALYFSFWDRVMGTRTSPAADLAAVTESAIAEGGIAADV
jgi:Delta7-sterol 5-desaturase